MLLSCCLVMLVLPLVSGQTETCDNMFARASVSFSQARRSVRRSSTLLGIAHGNGRTEKCPFLRQIMSTGGSGTCAPLISRTCPAPAQVRASFRPGVNILPNECRRVASVQCDGSSPYRTIDGTCNNLLNPDWGKAEIQQRRLLPNAYDDGQGTPRTRGCNNLPLPNPRTVSNNIHSAGPGILFENNLSLLVMQMGQFLIHDAVLTNLVTNPDGTHILCCPPNNNPNCNPIIIPPGDNNFPANFCMDFVRSKASTDCGSVRQVINSQTSYFDLSTVYGTSNGEAAFLRSFTNGRLKQVQNKLAVDFTDSTCVLSQPFHPTNYYCPIAGDGRVIEQPGLATLHTIFMREHNRLADRLAAVNPNWDDERLYQEARKINIGQWQNILYSEYLPTILGPSVMNTYGLNVSPNPFNDNYDPSMDATVSNAFAVAAFRFGHSMVHNLLGMKSPNQLAPTTEPLENHFFEPNWYHANNGVGLENILNWVTSTKCPFADRKLQDSIRQKLFLDSEGNSFDLATLNIHRGRDHGTPGYTQFRTLCGLSSVQHFGTGPGGLIDHDIESATLLQQTYNCPSDIDLFPGLLTEKRSQGSLYGPTWQCLIAAEFRRLRNGDRFFFERNDPTIGFTTAQLNSIKKTKLSNIICRNTNRDFIQPQALYMPSHFGPNRLLRCNRFRDINFRLWSERINDDYKRRRPDDSWGL